MPDDNAAEPGSTGSDAHAARLSRRALGVGAAGLAVGVAGLLLPRPASPARVKGRGHDAASLHAAYGITLPTDGTSDCRAAFDAIPAQAGVVFLDGVFQVSDTITMRPNVAFAGSGRQRTTIRADSTFPTTAGRAVVQQATVPGRPGWAHSTYLESLVVDAGGRADVAVRGVSVQEMSGLRDVVLTGWGSVGADYSGRTNQNFTIENVEIYGTNRPGSVGLRAGGSARDIRSVTSIPAGKVEVAGAAGTKGFVFLGAAVNADGLHAEGCEYGVYGVGSGSSVRFVTGNRTVPHLVYLPPGAGSNEFMLTSLVPMGSANTLEDVPRGYSQGPHALAIYSVGQDPSGAERRTVQ